MCLTEYLLRGDLIGGRPHVNLFIDVNTGDDEEYLMMTHVNVDNDDDDGYSEVLGSKESGKKVCQGEFIIYSLFASL